MLINKYSYMTEDSNGTRRHFYYEPGKGINCITKDNDAKESSPYNLAGDGTDDFSADIEGEYIYMLYKDTDNKINLMIWNGSTWSKSPLMKKPITGSVKDINILVDHGFIHIFYENSKDSIYYLVHHFWNRNKWTSSVIVKSNNNLSFHFVKGPSGPNGIYGEGEKLMYMSFRHTPGIWSKPVVISNIDDSRDFFIASDSKNNSTHIIYSAGDKLHYVRKTSGNWPSNDEQDIVLFPEYAQYPGIVCISENLWATWYCGGFIYTCLSADSGETWSQPFKISSEIDTLSHCCFISLKKFGADHVHAFYHTKNPYYLILIDDIFDPHSSGFSYFTIYINQIQQYIDQLSGKLREQKNINKEFILNMRNLDTSYKNLSTQYSLLKNSYSNILEEISDLKSENENIKSENAVLTEKLDKANGSLIKKLFSRVYS